MPVWRLQVEWAMDTPFARDRMVITPHFNETSGANGPQGLCDDLVAALNGWDAYATEVRVTAYDAQGTPPVFPQGSAIANETSYFASGTPRETAVCLSFYADRNLPRQRGRLFIPVVVMGAGQSDRYVPQATMQKVGDLATIFADLGGVDVDWSVYSRADDEARAVSNWWVDNEWDTIRSRGLRATERITGTVDE